MRLLGKDCGCEGRAAESGISNLFQYWLWWKPLHVVRTMLYRLLSLKADLKPVMRGLILGEHMMVAEGHLTARITRANGSIEERDLGYNTITDAAVAKLADDFNNAAGGADVSLFNFHAWGTGACGGVPPACGATLLVTEAAEARVSGTRSQPAANQFRSVGTITATGNKTITEWGMFNIVTANTITAWSLRCFSGSSIGVLIGDSIEFTYTVTFTCVSG